jgi:hypothetical protein
MRVLILTVLLSGLSAIVARAEPGATTSGDGLEAISGAMRYADSPAVVREIDEYVAAAERQARLWGEHRHLLSRPAAGSLVRKSARSPSWPITSAS